MRSASASIGPVSKRDDMTASRVGSRMPISTGGRLTRRDLSMARAMERRALGGPHRGAGVLGFGGSEIGYQKASLKTVERLLGSALDAGLNVIDTAECYEDSEELIGRAVGPRRDEFHLFTKCGHARGEWRSGWRPGALLRSIERSLKRLRADRVDLVQLHSCSLDVLKRGD